MTETKGLNFAILASAGTGKTYQLSVRIARLLMLGRKPEEIIALTFTRTAAAEFYLRALERLKEAATDDAKRLTLCGLHPASDPSPVDRGNPLVLDPTKYPKAAFAARLRELVLTSDRLLLSTLDSFFVRLVNQFALELGLETSKPVTVPEQEAPALAESAMRSMIAEVEAQGLLDQLGGQLNDYSDGRAAGNPTQTLLGMAASYHELLTLARDPAKWGTPEAIWPGTMRPEWLEMDDAKGAEGNDIAIVVGKLRTYPEGKNGGTTWRDQLTRQFEGVAGARRMADLDPAQLQGFLERYKSVLEAGCERLDVIHYGETVTLDAAETAAARRVLQALMSLAIRTASRRTKALHACLAGFERAYDLQVRRKGLLSFSDYVVLLNEWLSPLGEEVGPVLEDIHFRLDAKVKHWLLDEFQDTSTRQYDVLRRNIDEIVGAAAEDRSVFVVGDTKQSLYEWRAGNRELLSRINEKIKANGNSRPMDETRRCSPQVLTMVNALLENLCRRELGRFFSPLAAEDWDKVFREQKAHPAAPRVGRAEWIRLTKPKNEPDEGDAAEDASGEETSMAERHAAWIATDLVRAKMLANAAPGMPRGLRHGVTCAVLVSKNSQARAIAETLRLADIEATDEASTAVVRDNPVTAGLFALVEATAHPDNALARGLAWMSPTARRLVTDASGAPDWGKATRRIATLFAERGAEAVADWLVGSIAKEEVNPFLEKRLRQFRAVAADYDATGRRDLADFIAYADGTHLRDMATSNSVQVITIHHSKGLEYGIVYMPCLNDSHHKMAGLRNDLLHMTPSMRAKAEGSIPDGVDDGQLFRPDWILAGMNMRIAELVPGLDKSIAALKAESAYGSLCRLYVGMTRAKVRLVMVSDRLPDNKLQPLKARGGDNEEFFEHPANDGSHDFACFLESSLSRTSRGWRAGTDSAPDASGAEVVWTDGSAPDDLGWTAAFEAKAGGAAPATTATAAAAGWGDFDAVVRPRRLKPSSHSTRTEAPWQKATSELRGKGFGTYVHDLFARLGGDADGFLRELAARRTPEGMEEVHAKAVARIQDCLADPAIRELLVGNLGGKVLWVERKAAIHRTLEGGDTAVVPAVFDRVHITPGKEALIIDYKTARDATDEALRERYQEQMSAYREAVSRLTGIPTSAIRCKLVGIRTDSDELSVVEVG